MEAPAVPLVDLEHSGTIYPGSLSFFFFFFFPDPCLEVYSSRPLSPGTGEMSLLLKGLFFGVGVAE